MTSLPAACKTPHQPAPGWVVPNSHHDICSADLPCDPYPEAVNLVTFIINTIKTLPIVQCYPTTSPALPVSSKEIISSHCSTVMRTAIPPCFCDGDNIKTFLLNHSFQLLLLAAHTVCWCGYTPAGPMALPGLHHRPATLGSSLVILHFLRCIWYICLRGSREWL